MRTPPPNHDSSMLDEVRPFFGFRDELTVDDNVIVIGSRAVIPASLHSEYLKVLHKGHPGIDATKSKARESVFWSSLNEDIENIIKACSICNSLKPHQQKEPLKLHAVPDLPWSVVATDIFEWNSHNYLVLVDSYSGWYEIDQLSSLSSLCVINKLKRHFTVHGIPQTLYSDNGTQFTSQAFCDFSTLWDFLHVTSSPEYPQSNGLSERAVRSAKKLLETTKRDGTDFYLNLLNIWNMPRVKILGSPAQRLLSRRTRTTLPVCKQLLKPAAKATTNIQAQLTKKRRAQKRCYDKNTPKEEEEEALIPELGFRIIEIDCSQSGSGTEDSMSVEVERKFLCDPGIKDKLRDIGAVCVDQRRFHDQYFDSPDFVLTLNDVWLRCRQGCWELKCPAVERNQSRMWDQKGRLCTKYREIIILPQIIAKVREVMGDKLEEKNGLLALLAENEFKEGNQQRGYVDNRSPVAQTVTCHKDLVTSHDSKPGNPGDSAENNKAGETDDSSQSCTESNNDVTWLKEMSLAPFAEFTTERCSFVLVEEGEEAGIRVDLDEADFGYCVGEIEVLVPDEKEVQFALQKIERTAQRLGLSGDCRVDGKMAVYLQRYLPEHYSKLNMGMQVADGGGVAAEPSANCCISIASCSLKVSCESK
ncbi:hypothetical protein GJAV_G00076230 [Gymnothorax javanicus]|nr:hypothetical protein GJAV_G00076230 [Gymnothorax javanicus]